VVQGKADNADLCETSRSDAFCNFTILHDEVFVVPDARADRSFARNRFVTGEPYIRFYAGAPLTIRRGIHLGSLCVVDTEPRDFGPQETRLLKGLSRLVVDEIWLHHLSETGRAAIEMLSSDPRDRQLEFESSQAPTNAQIRAARGLLNWSARDLAEAANVSETSIKRIEAQWEGPIRRDSLKAAVRAFHKQG
jgi:GAF domain-containing protein